MQTIPGTALPRGEDARETFSAFHPLIDAAGGLSLSQVCSITGLEGSTIQNWVKRGWVPKPVNKKYDQMHLPRILLISALRENVQIEQLVSLLEMVSQPGCPGEGRLEESVLYDALCETVDGLTASLEGGFAVLGCHIGACVQRYANEDHDTSRRLSRALRAMACWYFAGVLRHKANEILGTIER